jgi:hypothetical protein
VTSGACLASAQTQFFSEAVGDLLDGERHGHASIVDALWMFGKPA